MTPVDGPVDALHRFRLDGRVAIVTGASAGLGERFARVLAGAGARVVLAARRIDRISSLAAELGDALAVRCDLTEAADRERLVERALERFDAVDVLVNNAGAAHAVPSEQESPERMGALLDLNVVALFAMCTLVAGHMLERGRGSIVNVASMYGIVSPDPDNPLASYAASKAAVVMLSRQLGVEWAARGVRVNALCPGYFPSEMTAWLLADDERRRSYIDSRTPAGRPGREGELDGALLLLASDAGSYMTGSAVVVDGGWTAH